MKKDVNNPRVYTVTPTVTKSVNNPRAYTVTPTVTKSVALQKLHRNYTDTQISNVISVLTFAIDRKKRFGNVDIFETHAFSLEKV